MSDIPETQDETIEAKAAEAAAQAEGAASQAEGAVAEGAQDAGQKVAENPAKEPTLEEKYAELEKAYADMKDQFLRKCADMENFRKRTMRDKQDAYDYANTTLLTDLVAILDDFDRALAAGQGVDGKTPDLKPVVDGIKMINKQMRGLLEAKYNLSAYGVKGDAFDPDIHEAIATAQAPVAEPVCAEVYLKGYKLKERVIRPAKVMVHMPNGEAPAAGTDGAAAEAAKN